MEDQQNGYLYESASPLEQGVSDYRDQTLIVWRHGEDAETAQLVRVISAEELSEVLWSAGLLLPRTEEMTP